MNKESAVKNISDMLISGKVAPWKAEQAALDEGISTPQYGTFVQKIHKSK